MRILQPTSTTMVIKDSAPFVPLVAVIFIVFGALGLFSRDWFTAMHSRLLFILFLALGLLVAIFWTITTVIIDRDSGLITKTERSLARRRLQSFPLADVAASRLTVEQEKSQRGRVRYCSLVFILKDGSRVNFSETATTFCPARERIGRAMADFIGVPFEGGASKSAPC
ncbi:MAG: hypothetical protein V1723_01390 [Candidatus Uhrbacteria bacterium]